MKYTVAKSNIQGKGLFAKEGYKKGEIIGLSHVDNKPTGQIGKYHNHSDKPTAVNIKKGNQRYLIANVDIPAGVEITTNYRKQPELEQPEDFQQADDYAKGGYIIEDISIPSLNQMDKGGEPKNRKKERFAEGTYDPNETAGYMLEEEEVYVPVQASKWGKAAIAYEKRNPEEKFIEKKKRQYIKAHPSINKLFGTKTSYGLASDPNNYAFAKEVEDNFKREYEYKKNTAVVKKVGRQEGWNPNKRNQYIDDLNDTQRGIVAESKFGNKLQAGYWNRALAGVQELGNTLLPGQPFKYNIPGLTKNEQKEIRNDSTSAVEVFAPIDIPGIWIANALKNKGLTTGSNYKDIPSWYSGQKMANVTDEEATYLNPLTYYGLEALPKAIASGVKVGYKGLKSGINFGKELNEASKAFNVSNLFSEGVNTARTLQESGFAKNINGNTFNAIPAKSAFSQAVSNLSSAVAEIPKSIKYQVNNYSNIKKAPTLVKDEIGKMLTPEGIDRLKNLGVDDIDDFMSYMDKNKLFTKRNLKSHAGTGVSNGQEFPYMNIDFDQLDKAFNLSKIKDKDDAIRAVISHELGHNIQGYLEHIGKSTDGLSSLDKEAVLKLKPFMDKNADPDVLNYFLQGSKGSEPLAHLRELKQNMLYKGVINDIHQKITPEDLGNFYINKSGYRDRVMSIVKPGDDAYKRLASLLNKTPVAIPAALGAGTLLNQEKDGGQIIIDDLTDAQLEQYIRGGYIIEEIH